MHVEYDTNPNFTSSSKSFTTITTTVNETTDFTGHIRIYGLAPDSQYYYRVWFSGQNQEGKNSESQGSEVTDSIIGAFRTAPDQSASKKTVHLCSCRRYQWSEILQTCRFGLSYIFYNESTITGFLYIQRRSNLW